MSDFAVLDRALLVEALKEHRWILKHAAKALGISRQTLYATMRRFQVERRPMDPAFLKERAHRAASAPRPSRRSAA